MSNFLSVATVTATLVDLLQSTLGKQDHDVQGATVTTLRPNKTMPETCVNVFLYQATPNPHFRNADLPSRSSTGGGLVQRPRLALNLHYLITFYGDENELVPQRLLGSVTRTLHKYPVLTRQQIQHTIQSGNYPYLATSDLASDIELVKFTPMVLSLEEMSKLWSVFYMVDYSLSFAYQASVVFVESEDTFAAPLPVRKPNVTVVPFNFPAITSIDPKVIPYEVGATLTIRGTSLLAKDSDIITKVALGEMELEPDETSLVDRLTVSLPDNARAGVQTVQVRQQIDTGENQHRSGFESGIATIVIQPVVLNEVGFSSANAIQQFHVTAEPTVGARQRAELLLKEVPLDSNQVPRTYTIAAVPRAGESNMLIFKTTGIPQGTYTVRIRIDGAESAWTSEDELHNNPTAVVQ